jgi:DNA modification methylase
MTTATEYMTDLTARHTEYVTSINDVKVLDQYHGELFSFYHGDCVEAMKGIPGNSVGYSIYSPPFASLYTYSNSAHDMGNVRSHSEFYEHYRFLIKEQYRTLIPGRVLSCHCMNLPTSKERDGYIGIHDFRGDLIRLYQEAGFIYHSECVIWKDPVVARARTNALGLLHKQVIKDSAMCRQGIPDYLITFRKPGKNPDPVQYCFDTYYGSDPEPTAEYTTPTDNRNWYSIEVWQRYADPIWMDIDPSDTLQYRSARENDREKHICPLQKTVIRRGIQLWSNPGDTILDPFGGIGTTPYIAMEMKRKGIGIELKRSYYEQAVKNCQAAEQVALSPTLFDLIDEQETAALVGVTV